MIVPGDRPLTTPSRYPEQATYDQAAAHALLDEAYAAPLRFVVDGQPRVLPTLLVRVGDTLYLHGSTGAGRLARARGDGLPVCVAVTAARRAGPTPAPSSTTAPTTARSSPTAPPAWSPTRPRSTP